MDGTGDLFAAFASALRVELQVVRYPTDRALGYDELEDLVASKLPSDSPYVVLGESFSGPIALSIASVRPALLRGVVLCCSFASNPRPGLGPLRGLVSWLPERPPVDLLMWALAGRFGTPALRDAFAKALAQVSASALRARMSAVLRVNVVPKLRSVSVPVLYLQATADRVVPPNAARVIVDTLPQSEVVEIAAPHFLLQTRPMEAARVVEDFVRKAAHAL